MTKSNASLSDKAGFLIVANLIKYAVGFVMPMVLVRMLDRTEYGSYQQMLLVGNTTVGILTLGLPTSVYYFFHHVTPERQPALVAQTTLMLVATGLLAALGIYVWAPTIAGTINNPMLIRLLQLYGLSTMFFLASEHSISFMIAQNRYSLAVMIEVGETFFRVALLLAPLWMGFGLTGLIVGIVIYALVRFVVRNVYLFTRSGLHFAGWTKHTFIGGQLAYSIPIALGSLSGLIGGTFNRGILATSFTPAYYAIYAVGAQEIPLDVIFQAAVANVLRASLPPLVRDGNLVEVVRLLRESVRKLSMIVLPSFIFLLGCSHEFITVLFTLRYAESVDVFRIYLLLVPLHMFTFSLVPQVFGKTKVNLYIIIAMAVVLTVSGYVLFKIVGFYGPAIAVIVAQYFGFVVYLVVVLRQTQSSIFGLLPLAHMARVAGLSLVALAAARMSLHATAFGLLNLALMGVIFSAVFLSSAWLTGTFTSGDRELLKRWVVKFLPARIR